MAAFTATAAMMTSGADTAPPAALPDPERSSSSSTERISATSSAEHHGPDPVPPPIDSRSEDHPAKRPTHWHPAVPSTSAAAPAAALRGPAC